MKLNQLLLILTAQYFIFQITLTKKIAYEALQRYKKWETEALNSFITWEDMDITNGVMEELKEVNAALNILDENGINYDNMLYISNHIG